MRTMFFEHDGGKLAYDDNGGQGQLVMMLPGIGDVRGEYRFVAPELRQAGYRVVTVDLRGHGESSVGWPEYTVAAVGRDILALIDHLQAGPAIIVATSFSPGAAVWAATERPEAIKGLALIGPFVREHPLSPIQKLVQGLLLNGPWKVWAWDKFYQSLYPTRQPEDFAIYRAGLRANLAEPGRFEALKKLGFSPNRSVETRLAQVQAPAMVIMGSQDPDFHPPQAEAEYIAQRLDGRMAMIEGAGHYPHAEMPEQVLPLLTAFLSEIGGTNGAQARA